MAPMRALVLSVAALAVTASEPPPNEAYKTILDSLIMQVDTNSDGALNPAEMYAATQLLGVTQDGNPLTRSTTDAWLAQADSNGNGKLDPNEFPKLVEQHGDVDWIKSLTNTPDLAAFSMPDSAFTAAKSKVVTSFSVAGAISDIFPSTRRSICNFFSTTLSISPSMVKCTFMPGSVVVTATAYVADTAAADAASQTLTAALGGGAASAALGVTVAGTVMIKPSNLGASDVDFATAGMYGGGLVVLTLLFCFISCKAAKKCCGCANYKAIKSWASANVTAAVAILAALFVLYSSMDKTTAALKQIIDALAEISTSSGLGPASDATANIPKEMVNMLKDYVDLLSIAVLVPGLLAAALLLISGMCGCRGPKSLCCSKCFVFLGDIFLLLCLVFYGIFAGLGYAVSMPIVKDQLSSITGICDSLLPDLQQAVADASSSLSMAVSVSAGPADIAQIQDLVDSGRLADRLFSLTCGGLSSLFKEFGNLFLPGTFCVVAVLFAFVSNHCLCCAASCCATPKVVSAGADGKGIEMKQPAAQNV